MANAIVTTNEKQYSEFSSDIITRGLELASLVFAAQCQVKDLPSYEQSEDLGHLYNVLEVIKKNAETIADEVELSQHKYGLIVSA